MSVPAISPGTYLRLRREAAGKSIADVAAALATAPYQTPEHILIAELSMLEADQVPARFTTIVALLSVFRFDIRVLAMLDAIRLGLEAGPISVCEGCGCSWFDGCRTPVGGCRWTDETETVCTSCVKTAGHQHQARAA